MSILSDAEPTPKDLGRRAKTFVHDVIRPALSDLRKSLRSEQVRFVPGLLEAALYAEAPGVVGALAGQSWALVAAPMVGMAVKGVTFAAERREMLRGCPWSYLYRADAAFANRR